MNEIVIKIWICEKKIWTKSPNNGWINRTIFIWWFCI